MLYHTTSSYEYVPQQPCRFTGWSKQTLARHSHDMSHVCYLPFGSMGRLYIYLRKYLVVVVFNGICRWIYHIIYWSHSNLVALNLVPAHNPNYLNTPRISWYSKYIHGVCCGLHFEQQTQMHPNALSCKGSFWVFGIMWTYFNRVISDMNNPNNALLKGNP